MAFGDFTYPNVEVELGLTTTEDDLFPDVVGVNLPPAILERLRLSADLGFQMNTEKARSEFIVAPLLFELRLLHPKRFGMFSGVGLDVDTSRGLNGTCDFILTRSPLLTKLTAPVLAIALAKKDDIRGGLGQCIAATVAAREYNALEKRPPTPVYGAVTTGTVVAVPSPRWQRADARRSRLLHCRAGPHPRHSGAHRRMT